MKTILDKITRDELIRRINTLNESCTAQWGKMNIGQMVDHCIRYEEMILGRIKCKRSFLGLLFGRVALKSLIKDESPIRQNMPTSPEIRVKENFSGDIASGKEKWIALMEEFCRLPNQDFLHPFFGRMTKEQVGRLSYKHMDHHLRQFNC
ncbi:DUF1569 domain-containing protein [Flavitalea sp. BT771]|uniref:DUF1569 domain-containing protein n=1 Tax=Flavitalea sp. BT771 TaxID=3063329 RepID=UPI0026E45853|nr:DUF1569 domain-containing protein [Flavitalea sp. BT771]MDO6430249.1 DUF1569 domain-containing protein [Flavitalea sp. BT771]MDV6219611.1 DUF1569 domain-containing protein [Flavitalea sp. BT771]